MNLIIAQYFDAIEARFLQSFAIASYQILRREIAGVDGKLRANLVLVDGSVAEMFEYVREIAGQIQLLKYSFHWQEQQGRLRRRWDNAPHFPDLPNAPHHVHEGDGSVVEAKNPPNMLLVIEEFENGIQAPV